MNGTTGDWTAGMVMILAAGNALLSLRYIIVNRMRRRSRVYLVQLLAAIYMAGIYGLSIAEAVSMQDIAGRLFRLGIALLLAAGVMGAIVDQ